MRASPIIATFFPIKGAKPKSRVRLAIVGPTTLLSPTSALSTVAIVPLPERRGPTNNMIFCCEVSDPRA